MKEFLNRYFIHNILVKCTELNLNHCMHGVYKFAKYIVVYNKYLHQSQRGQTNTQIYKFIHSQYRRNGLMMEAHFIVQIAIFIININFTF